MSQDYLETSPNALSMRARKKTKEEPERLSGHYFRPCSSSACPLFPLVFPVSQDHAVTAGVRQDTARDLDVAPRTL